MLKDLFQIFYPDACAVCDKNLVENEKVICTLCRHDLPLTKIDDFHNNFIINKFYGRVTVENAFSLLLYRKKGVTQKMIQELKYRGNEKIGAFFGDWIGSLLKNNQEYKKVDVLIPVPLHSQRFKERGYNQVTLLTEKLSIHLQKPIVENALKRVTSTKTQAFKARFERFNNVDTKFELKDTNAFENKHVLLIDDVVTTGATLEACSKEFLKAKNCKISVITIAAAE